MPPRRPRASGRLRRFGRWPSEWKTPEEIGAEASSSESLKKEDGCLAHEHLNGHAIAMLIPTAQLLTALDSGARSYVVTQAKTKALVENEHSAARGTRFDALFPRAFVETHYAPNGEGGWYESLRLLDEDQMDE